MGRNGPAPKSPIERDAARLRETPLAISPIARKIAAEVREADDTFLPPNVIRRETIRGWGRDVTSTEFYPEPSKPLPKIGQYLPEFGGIVVSISEPSDPFEFHSALFGPYFPTAPAPPVVTVHSSGSARNGLLPGAWGPSPLESADAREAFKAFKGFEVERSSLDRDHAVDSVRWGVSRGFPKRWTPKPSVILHNPRDFDYVLDPPPPAPRAPCAHVRQERRKIRDWRGRLRRGLYCGECGERLVPPAPHYTPEEIAVEVMLVLLLVILGVNVFGTLLYGVG
jgi:hypothetical protein